MINTYFTKIHKFRSFTKRYWQQSCK